MDWGSIRGGGLSNSLDMFVGSLREVLGKTLTQVCGFNLVNVMLGYEYSRGFKRENE